MTPIGRKQKVSAEINQNTKRKKMKNKFMQTTVGTFLALLMLFGTTQIFVSGQTDERNDSDASSSLPNQARKSIEGVWQTTVTQRNCQTGEVIRIFRGLSAYHEGGTMSETSAALSPALRSPGYGVWDKESNSTYSSSFIFQRFNPDGAFAGTQQTTSTIVLSDRGNTYDTTTSIRVFDANNNLLGTGCATATATRFE
jgi:hypothetical protein